MPADQVVHVIDDDDAARDSLAFLLRSSEFAVQTHESAVDFLAALPILAPACIITDVRMPTIDGIELLRRLKALQVPVPVIVITGQGDVTLALEAIRAGAIDFIEKPYDHESLIGAVRSALDMETMTSTEDSQKTTIRERLATLTPAEKQVLDGLVAGHSNKTIALQLETSPRTVEVHRANVMTKMQAKSLAYLVRMTLLAGPGT